MRRLGPSELDTLRKLLKKMNPKEARSCRAEVRDTYFKQGRSTVKLDPTTTIDLWEIVGDD